MLVAHASMSAQFRKSPAGMSTRAAGMSRAARCEKPSLPGFRAPKNTRVARGLRASRNSANSFGSDVNSTSRPFASVVAVPSGPLLNSHTGRAVNNFWLIRTKSLASLGQDPI